MRLADVSQPATGAYVTLETLIGLRFPASQLQLTRRNRALSALTGPNKANFRGRGIDFEEVRSYQAGDDIRTIDWRVTARTGAAHTKVFREERERPVLVVVDQRGSQFFGSQHCFKSVLAAHLAGLLAWSALGNGDRVGGLVFNDSRHREVRPRRSRKTVLTILSQIEAFNRRLPPASGDDHSLAAMLDNLRRIARPGYQYLSGQRLLRRRGSRGTRAPVPAGAALGDYCPGLRRPAGDRAATGGPLRLYRRSAPRRAPHCRPPAAPQLLPGTGAANGRAGHRPATPGHPSAASLHRGVTLPVAATLFRGAAPMNPQDPLAALHPLRTPEPVPWWPPAPGWWLLAGLLLAALAWAAWCGWRRYRSNRYRRTARQAVQVILARHAEHGDSARTLGELNTVLKAVALRSCPRARSRLTQW